MSQTVAILAPTGGGGAEADFVLRLRERRQELTLMLLCELAKRSFHLADVPASFLGQQSGETIPAAGFFLEGFLRAAGYRTALAGQADDTSLRRLAQHSPLALCLSSTMLTSRQALTTVVNKVRDFMPDVPIIVGGLLIWKSYWLLQSSPIDPAQEPKSPALASCAVFPCRQEELDVDLFIVARHGGRALLDVLALLERGRRDLLTELPNLALPDEHGEFRFAALATESIEPSEEMIRWDLVDELPTRIPLRTSIGCPRRCRYCDFWQLHPQLHLRSRDSLLAELSLLGRRLRATPQPAIIQFTDDNAFATRGRTAELCQLLIDSNIELPWTGFIRTGPIDTSTIELIQRSRLLLAMVGVESGDSGQLSRMNKRQDLQRVRQGIELLDHAGITVLMTFIIGYPGETKETLEQTASWINSLQLDTASSSYQLFPLRVEPLSDLAGGALRREFGLKGIIDSWTHATMSATEARQQCYALFKQIPSIPYHYRNESAFFNRRFDPDRRQRLFQLRHQLTVLLAEGAPVRAISEALLQLSQLLGLGEINPPADFIDELFVSTPLRHNNGHREI